MRLLSMLVAATWVAGAAFASEPHTTYIEGNTGGGETGYIDCEAAFRCQYGFEDTSPNSGFTLDQNQQLGIVCAAPSIGAGIVSVGFFSSFWVTVGDLDIVIHDADTGAVLSSTRVFIDGGNDRWYKFDVPTTVVDNACVMLCPLPGTWGVAGEDPLNGPFGNTFFSNNCFCDNEFTTQNLVIFTCWNDGPIPVENETWGALKAIYR